MTPFALLCQVCGLSQREAAAMFGVRLDTVKSWGAGRNRAPDRVLAELAALAARIEMVAAEALDQLARLAVANGSPEVIELGLASDDAEAQSLGCPCVGAHRAILALVVARGTAAGYHFAIVQRGSTLATAGAADIHRR